MRRLLGGPGRQGLRSNVRTVLAHPVPTPLQGGVGTCQQHPQEVLARVLTAHSGGVGTPVMWLPPPTCTHLQRGSGRVRHHRGAGLQNYIAVHCTYLRVELVSRTRKVRVGDMRSLAVGCLSLWPFAVLHSLSGPPLSTAIGPHRTRVDSASTVRAMPGMPSHSHPVEKYTSTYARI